MRLEPVRSHLLELVPGILPIIPLLVLLPTILVMERLTHRCSWLIGWLPVEMRKWFVWRRSLHLGKFVLLILNDAVVASREVRLLPLVWSSGLHLLGVLRHLSFGCQTPILDDRLLHICALLPSLLLLFLFRLPHRFLPENTDNHSISQSILKEKKLTVLSANTRKSYCSFFSVLFLSRMLFMVLELRVLNRQTGLMFLVFRFLNRVWC